MSAFTSNLTHSYGDSALSRATSLRKRFLNRLTLQTGAAVDRRRFASLSRRYLDDVGVTLAERAEILGYEEPRKDPWSVVGSQRW